MIQSFGNCKILISTPHQAYHNSSVQFIAATWHNYGIYSRSALYSLGTDTCVTCICTLWLVFQFHFFALVSARWLDLLSFASAPFFLNRIARSSFTSNKFSQYFKRLYQIELRQLLFAFVFNCKSLLILIGLFWMVQIFTTTKALAYRLTMGYLVRIK